MVSPVVRLTVTYRGNRSQTSSHDAAGPPSPSAEHDRGESQSVRGSEFDIPLEMRWGVDGHNLRAVWKLHEQVLDSSYSVSHYESLLGTSWLSLIAYTTREAYDAVISASAVPTPPTLTDKPRSNTNETVTSHDGQSLTLHVNRETEQATSNTNIIAGVVKLVSELQLSLTGAVAATDTSDMSRISTIDEMISQAEKRAGVARGHRATDRVVVPGQQEANTTDKCDRIGGDAPAARCVSEHETAKYASTSAPFDVVIGFAIGAIGYAGYGSADILCVNPTGYVGFLGVAPAFQSCHIGTALMRHALHYMTHDLPIHADAYLHYSAASMKKLICSRDNSKKSARTRDSQDGLSESAPATGVDSSAFEETSSTTGATPGAHESTRLVAPLIRAGVTTRAEQIADHRESGDGQDGAPADRSLPSEEHQQGGEHDDMRDGADGATSSCGEADLMNINPVIQYGVSEVWLHCLRDRPELLSFYKRLHFREMRVLRNFYYFANRVHDASFLLYTKSSEGETHDSEDEDDDAAVVHTASASSATAMTATTITTVDHDDVAQTEGVSSTAMPRHTAPRRDIHENDFVQTLLQHDQERQKRHEARRAALKQVGTSEEGGHSASVAKNTADGAVNGAPGEADATRSLLTSDAAVPSSGSTMSARSATATATTTKVRLRAQWLVPARYAEVWDVHCATTEDLKEKWRQQMTLKTVDLTNHDNDGYVTRVITYLVKNSTDIVFSINALAAVCLVCYCILFGMPKM